MNNYSIITACIRPHNLPLLLKSILESKGNLDLNITWYVMIEGRKREAQLPNLDWVESNCPIKIVTGIGEEKSSPVNLALDLIQKEESPSWVVWLDDDNLMHPDYFSKMQEEATWPAIVIYNQQMTKTIAENNPRVRLVTCGVNPGPGTIDTGQFTISSNLIGFVTWDDDNSGEEPDGKFIKHVHYWNNDKLRRINHVMAYYNFLA